MRTVCIKVLNAYYRYLQNILTYIIHKVSIMVNCYLPKYIKTILFLDSWSYIEMLEALYHIMSI